MLPLFNLFVQTAYAAVPNINPADPGSITPTDPSAVINNVYTQAFDVLTVAAGALATIYLIWFGIQYITSAGDAAKAKQARAGIVNAVVGIVIIIAAYAIIRLAILVGRQVNATAGGATASGSESSGATGTTASAGGSGSWTITASAVDSLSGSPVRNLAVTLDGGTRFSGSAANGSFALSNPTAGKSYLLGATATSASGQSLQCQQQVSFTGNGSISLSIPPRTTPLTPCGGSGFTASQSAGTDGAGSAGSTASTAQYERAITVLTTDETGDVTYAGLDVSMDATVATTGASGSTVMKVTAAKGHSFSLRAYSTANANLACTAQVTADTGGTLTVGVPPRTTPLTPCAIDFQESASLPIAL